MDDLAAYYAKRAAEYERFYDKPERQAEYAALRERVAQLLAGRRVLELACGTGYWTKVMAATAAEVTALDLNQEVLDVAASKNLPKDKVVFGIGNAYADEILWEAKLHPKRTVRSLTRVEQIGLYDAMQHVLARAVDEVEAGTPPELGVKVRSHLKVRGRYGTPCPRCGSDLRRTRKGDDETDYCSTCQPPPPGQLW